MNSDSTVSVTGSRCVLANSLVHRVLEYDGDVWRTTTFARADSSDANRIVSDEFLILLLDGRRHRKRLSRRCPAPDCRRRD